MQNALMTKIVNKNKRSDIPEFRPGDTIRVHVTDQGRRQGADAGV